MCINNRKYRKFIGLAAGFQIFIFIFTSIVQASPSDFNVNNGTVGYTLQVQSIFNPILDVIGQNYEEKVHIETAFILARALKDEGVSCQDINAELDAWYGVGNERILNVLTNPCRENEHLVINIGVLGNPSLIFKIVSSCKDIKDMQNSAEKTEIFPVFKNGVTTLENIPKSFKDTQEFEIAQKMLLPIEEFAASEPLSTKEILIDRIESQLGRILTAYEDLEYDYLKGLENIDAVLDSILSDQRIIGMVREVIERQINHDVKVVLINPNHRSGFMSVKPLGLARVGSNLKANGIITEYIDADNKGYSAAVLAKEVACLRNSVKGPMVLGISVLPGGKEYLKEFFANLSGMTNGMKDVYIATGGYLPTMTFREFMDAFPEIDFVIKAEGEAAMVELVRAINGHTSMNEVMNLVYRDNSGKAVESKKYHVLSREELDKLPPPDYSKLIDADDLFWKKTLLDTSRGCPGYCNFCGLHDFMGESKSDDVTRRECKIKDKWWRGRSPKKVVDEMEYLHKKFGITGVDIVDDDFIGYDPGRAKLIAEEILARGLHINFWCLARSDSVVSAGVETMSL